MITFPVFHDHGGCDRPQQAGSSVIMETVAQAGPGCAWGRDQGLLPAGALLPAEAACRRRAACRGCLPTPCCLLTPCCCGACRFRRLRGCPDIDLISPGSQPAMQTGSPFHWLFLTDRQEQASGREEPADAATRDLFLAHVA